LNYNERASVKALITSNKLIPPEKTSFGKKKGDISEKIIHENLYIQQLKLQKMSRSMKQTNQASLNAS